MEKLVNGNFIFLLTCLALLVFLNNKLYAQVNPLQRKITLVVSNESLEKTLQKISEQGKFNFSYNSDIIPLDSVISLNVSAKETGSILGDLLGVDYYYKTSGNYIIILKTNEKKNNNYANTGKTKYTITGTIVDSRSGKKLTTATVYHVDKLETALTDSAGFFTIKVNPDKDLVGLGISKVNYYDTIIYIRPSDGKNIELKLNPKPELVSPLAPRNSDILIDKEVSELAMVRSVVGDEMLFNSLNIPLYQVRNWQLSFLPFAGTNHKLSGSVVNKFSCNILSGYSAGVDGVEIGGFLNINRKDMTGVQIAGFGNITGGNVKGFQAAGFFNNTMGKVNGVQVAGFSNTVFDTLNGVQVAGYVNIQKGNLNGTQLAGFVNVTTRNVEQMQIAGYVNIALGNCKGMQLSGFVNFSNADNNGYQLSGFTNFITGNNNKFQFSGFTNFAMKESKGTQLSCFLNYARDVKGCQIGLVNIADTVSGLSLGLFNFVKKGYFSLNLHYDEMRFLTLDYYMGTPKLYSIIGLSTNPFDTPNIWGATYGFGKFIRLNKRISLNVNLTNTWINRDYSWADGTSSRIKFSPLVNYQFTRNWALSAGPSLNVYISDKPSHILSDYVADKTPNSIYNKTIDNTHIQSWIGYSFALKYKFHF